jgi:hypothetical protein
MASPFKIVPIDPNKDRKRFNELYHGTDISLLNNARVSDILEYPFSMQQQFYLASPEQKRSLTKSVTELRTPYVVSDKPSDGGAGSGMGMGYSEKELEQMYANDEAYLDKAKKLLINSALISSGGSLASLMGNLGATPPEGMGPINLSQPDMYFTEEPYDSAKRDTMGLSIANQNLAQQLGRPELLAGLQSSSDQAIQKIMSQRGQDLTNIENSYLNNFLQTENTEAQLNERIGEVNMASRGAWEKERNDNIKEQISNLADVPIRTGEQALNIFNLKNQNAMIYGLLNKYAKAGQWNKVSELIAGITGTSNYVENNGTLKSPTQVLPVKV